MKQEKILIVDDEPIIRNLLKAILKKFSLSITTASNGKEAIEKMQSETFDYLMTDMKMNPISGIELLSFAKKQYPSTLVILMTAYGSIESAVEAMKKGAFEYLTKPFSEEAIEMILLKAREKKSLLEENQYLKHSLELEKKSNPIIAASPQMQEILRDLEKIASSSASVLLQGESGTGKEVVARAIHEHSKRKWEAYVKVNCSAIPETLIESEFFGYEKGAFTGADATKIGRFEAANRGTLLLDEVSETPLHLQPKLLRAIQEQEFERVGGVKTIHVNVRFIATTNRNMAQSVKDKSFREDLYYRLNVIPIYIPPLRQRKEDILPLANYFLEKFSEENHREKKTFSPSGLSALLSYPWPGNVRELANIIERTVVMDLSNEIQKEHLYLNEIFPTAKEMETLQKTTKQTLAQMEKEHILKTLHSHQDNRTQTAKELGISLRTLRNKLNFYNS